MIVGGVFAIATVIVYGLVLRRRVKQWRKWNDAAARRELVEAIALFAAGATGGGAILVVVVGPHGLGLGAMAAGVAWGALLAAGIVMLTEPPREHL